MPGAKLKAFGTRAGIPDLFVLKSGQLFALEVKREGGRVSAAQRAAMSDLEAAGAAVAVAAGIDAAIAQLEAWHLIR